MEDWAEIRRLHAVERMAIKAIVRKTGVSRNAVQRALASDSTPTRTRPAKGSVVDGVEQLSRRRIGVENPKQDATTHVLDRC